MITGSVVSDKAINEDIIEYCKTIPSETCGGGNRLCIVYDLMFRPVRVLSINLRPSVYLSYVRLPLLTLNHRI